MNWIQRLFHRHNFFPTPERRQLLGDQEWIDANTVSYAVLGEVDVEKCYDCGAKRLSVWRDGKRVAHYIERPRGRPDDRWTPYLKP
jgi:hypothetical protein